MFRTVPLSIIRCLNTAYTAMVYVIYKFCCLLASGILILLASCHQTSMTRTIVVYTVSDS